MAKVFDAFSDIFESYKSWVSSNPQTVGDLETTVKWVSYFISGRISNSPIISELTYSLSNLLVLFNDQIIAKSLFTPSRSGHRDDETPSRLKLLLTTLEYCEVFIEISAKHIFGDSGRWFFVCVVQVVKCIFRALLTYKYREPMVEIPATKTVNRREASKNVNANDDEEVNSFGANLSDTFELRRSGRQMRRVEGAPPIHLRNWKAPIPSTSSTGKTLGSDVQNRKLTMAETVYIFKPLVHLSSVASFGLSSWKSYGISLLMDAYSLHVYNTNRSSLTKQQQVELSRRNVQMLLYLMRSPFFEKYTRSRITGIVDGIGRNIPLTKPICNALNEYIPHWQSTYFYMWSS